MSEKIIQHVHAICRTTNSLPQQPTLQIYGDRDAAFTTGMFEDCSIKKNIELVKIEKCSHWAQQDCPQAVNTLIETFTRQCN